jgi:DNA-binding response OmpR family regulator
MAGKKVLIVDDEQAMLEVLERRLKAENFEVILATNGQEATEKIFQHKPDLIFMDIALPDIEGSDIVRRLQKDPMLRSIPVVFLSGILTREGNQVPPVRVGEWEYRALAKPFSYREFRNMVDELLKDR